MRRVLGIVGIAAGFMLEASGRALMRPSTENGPDAQAELANAMRRLERAMRALHASEETFSVAPTPAARLALFAAMGDEADSIAKVEILKQHQVHLPKER